MKRTLWLMIAGLLLWGSAAEAQTTTAALLDTLQHTSFNYFWNEANASNGLIRDRNQSGSAASIAAVGFGLSAICVGVDHGWVSRSNATDRVLTTLQTFWNGPQGTGSSGFIGYKGFFYHFLDMNTATRTWSSELSSIDTGLLLAGVVDAKQYFTGSDAREVQIRALSDSIYYRTDWNFMRNFNPGIMMGWNPGTGFGGYGQWVGYNEAMILYLLALGSPTHAVPTTAWTAWTSGYQWQTLYGQTYVTFPPLFGHQYSHCWVDFRGLQDTYMQAKGSDYFQNSRSATLAQRAYCMANPGGWVGYGDSLWGLTACDGPSGYNARGAPPAQNDDGTIAPTAAVSSMPFAPEVCLPAARNMYNAYHDQIWSTYGFRDAFNLAQNWWDTDFIGIDKGPEILMLENYRTGSIWNRFMLNLDIQHGLVRAGFTGMAAVGPGGGAAHLGYALAQNTPNPFAEISTLRYRIAEAGHVTLRVLDASGREVALLVDEVQSAGAHEATLAGRRLGAGVYVVRMECNGVVRAIKGIHIR